MLYEQNSRIQEFKDPVESFKLDNTVPTPT